MRAARYSHWLTALMCLFIIGVLLFPLENPIASDDSLRHLTIARLYKKEGIRQVSGWGEFFYTGYFTARDSDPWFLADMSYIPFASLPTTSALKAYIIASTAFLLLAMLLFFNHLKLTGTQSSLLLLALLFAKPVFLGRLFLARPFVLMTAISIILYITILKKNHVLAGAMMAIAVLTSHLFVFPLFLSVTGSIWLWTLRQRKSAVHLFLWTVMGIGIGLLLHPSTADYFHYLLTIFLKIPFSKHVQLGSEMQSGIGFGDTIIVATGMIVLMHVILHRKGVSLRQLHVKGIFMTDGFVAILLCAFFVWARTMDFLWPFLIMLIAQIMHVRHEILRDLMKLLFIRRLQKPIVFLSVFLLFCFSIVAQNAQKLIAHDGSVNLDNAGRSLANIPQHSRVLNIYWGDFPILVHARPDLTYATGIDATLMYLTNPHASELLSFPIHSSAFRLEDPVVNGTAWAKQILGEIPSDYTVVDKERFKNFIPVLRNTSVLEEIPNHGSIAVFKVKKL